MKHVPPYYWAIFLGYIGLLLIYYVYVYKKRCKGYNDYIIASQSVPWYYVVGSLMATTISGATFLGCMGYAYNWGGAYFSITFGNICSWLLIGIFIGPPLRKLNCITLPQFFEKRYGNNNVISKMVAIVTLLYMNFYLIATFIVYGLIGNVVFGIPNVVMVLIMGIAAVLMSAYSGQVGVFWTDLIQFVFLAIVLMVSGFIMMHYIPNPTLAGMFETIGERFSGSTADGFFSIVGTKSWGFVIGMVLVWGLGYCAHPAYLSRYAAAKSTREAYKVSIAQPIIYPIFWYGFFALAAFMPKILVNTTDGEMSYLLALKQITQGGAFGFILPLVAAAIFAAGFSTVNTFLLTSGSIFMEDLYRKKHPDKSDKENMKIARIWIICTGIAIVLCSLTRFTMVMTIASIAMSFCASALAIPLIGGLYWKKASEKGCLYTMYVGVVATAIAWILKFSGILKIEPMLPLMVVSFLTFIVVSLGTQDNSALAVAEKV